MRVQRLLGRVTIASRVALAAGILAALLLTGGALMVRAALHSAQMDATRQLAAAQASQIIDATRSDVRLFGAFGTLPYELVRTDGAVIASSPELADAEIDGAVLPPPPDEATQTGGEISTATITAGPLAGQTLAAVSSTLRASSIPGLADEDLPGGPVADSELVSYRAYVLVTTTAADRAVGAIDPYLWTGVALTIALLAGTAAVTARRSLGPVDQMRRAAEAISGAPGGARVTVPPTRDELSALAQTLNAMLARIDAAALRQQRFTADAAHELRSPITSLLTALEVAQAHPSAMPTEQTFAHVHAEARRLADLADDLLELSVVGQGAPDARSDARAVLHDVLREVQERQPRVPVRVGHLPPAGTIVVRMDARELRRVLVNLVENAVRHAASAVDVAVSLAEPSGVAGGSGDDHGDGRADDGENLDNRPSIGVAPVRIEIANDGPPIPAADAERIFEPFVRLDESRSRATGGAGLGLAIAHEIVARAGGTLTVASTPTRTAFTVILPADLQYDAAGAPRAG